MTEQKKLFSKFRRFPLQGIRNYINPNKRKHKIIKLNSAIRPPICFYY